MMHKSKLCGFIIDCKTGDLQDAARFWGEALGMEIMQLPGEEGERYVQLIDRAHDLHVEVQAVDHDSRVHLDIETDNMEAEIARLEKLGAKKLDYIHSWCVMEAPTGQHFCVVQKSTPGFEKQATRWKG